MRLLLVLTVSMCLFHSQHVTRAGDELEPLLEAQGAQLQQLQAPLHTTAPLLQ